MTAEMDERRRGGLDLAPRALFKSNAQGLTRAIGTPRFDIEMWKSVPGLGWIEDILKKRPELGRLKDDGDGRVYLGDA